MRQTVSVIIFIAAMIFWGGFSCSQRGDQAAGATIAPALSDPQDWTPPIFPGAVADQEIQLNMTAVAITPGALDESACVCFEFPVHDALFYAYHSEAEPERVLDFYSEQMAAQGWKRIAVDTADTTPPHVIWQHGPTGPLVAYLMAAPMEEGGTLIYLSVAVSDQPQKAIEE